jgi:sporulation protein YlmC with PRC-barrel domain
MEVPMRNFITATAATLLISVSTAAFAQATAADCQSMFQRADVDRDGALRADEAQLFTDAMAQAQLLPQDASSITLDEFLSACEQNAFANIDPAAIGPAQTTTIGEQPGAVGEPGVALDPAAPAAQPPEQALAVPAAVMASALIGADIYSLDNENIAKVKDIILSPEDGQATHVIVDAGDNDVAIEMSQIKVVATDYGFKVMMDAAQPDLASYPAVNQ